MSLDQWVCLYFIASISTHPFYLKLGEFSNQCESPGYHCFLPLLFVAPDWNSNSTVFQLELWVQFVFRVMTRPSWCCQRQNWCTFVVWIWTEDPSRQCESFVLPLIRIIRFLQVSRSFNKWLVKSFQLDMISQLQRFNNAQVASPWLLWDLCTINQSHAALSTR